MRRFGYMQGIPRAQSAHAPPAVLHEDIDKIFEALYYHLVPTDLRCVATFQL